MSVTYLYSIASCYQIGDRGSWTSPIVALLAFAEQSTQRDWPCIDNDEEVGLYWQHAVCQLRLWRTANNSPPPMRSATWWAMLPRRPHHSHKAGNGNTSCEGHEKNNRTLFMCQHLGWKRSLVTLKSTFVWKLCHLCAQRGHLEMHTISTVDHYQEQKNQSECF